MRTWWCGKRPTSLCLRPTVCLPFPRSETYGLSSQYRRAAVSIAANIAEGFKKREKADKLRFCHIAQGSIEESRYYLLLAKDLEHGDISEISQLLAEVSKLLEAYSQAILTSDF